MTNMTPRERFLVAITNGQPDRVPCAPDISNMIPAHLTQRPFWDIYYYNAPPLWRAYLDAVKLLDIDGWFFYGDPGFTVAEPLSYEQTYHTWSAERLIVGTRIKTLAGDLDQEAT